MSQILPMLAAVATVTQLQTTGAANANGAVLDLLTYKGAVTFGLIVGQSSTGAGTVANADIQDSADNTTFAAVSGGAFTNVVNTANASNVSVQLKSYEVRALRRYVRVPTVISGSTPNIPLSVLVIGQKERV